MKKATKLVFLCLTLSLNTITYGIDKTEQELAKSLGQTIRKFLFLIRRYTDKDTQPKEKTPVNTQAHTAAHEGQKKFSSLCSLT